MYSLLLFLYEIVFDNFFQASAVRLDEALQLSVVQSANLIVIELLVKLKQHRQRWCVTSTGRALKMLTEKHIREFGHQIQYGGHAQ